MDAMTVAVDLAKTTFEIAIADQRWHVVKRLRLTRTRFQQFLDTTPAMHLVMEACSTAHYWGRVARDRGHRVTLLPPAYVRPYVRRNKTDRADAEAILEAVRSGAIPPVPIKSIEQQALVALHRVREQWMATRIARLNALHGLLGEYGIVLRPLRRAGLRQVTAVLAAAVLPASLRRVLTSVCEEIRGIEERLAEVNGELRRIATTDPVAVRLQTVPGIGIINSTALLGTVGNIHAFRRGRQFASWLGITPSEYSSGTQRQLGGITKRGDRYLRCVLIHGARAVVAAARKRTQRPRHRLEQWAATVAARRGYNKASIAVANKMARIVWAVWTKDTVFDPRPALVA
jgi:transposase